MGRFAMAEGMEVATKRKTAPAAPVAGDRVRLKGRVPTGTLASVNRLNWAKVMWDKGNEETSLVHLAELEKI